MLLQGYLRLTLPRNEEAQEAHGAGVLMSRTRFTVNRVAGHAVRSYARQGLPLPVFVFLTSLSGGNVYNGNHI